MKIGIPKEVYPGECRVAATPETARRLIEKLSFDVVVQASAGDAASFPDTQYANVGCELVDDASAIWETADIILKVRSPEPFEVDQLRSGQTLVTFLAPAQNEELLQGIADRGATAISMDAIPRISRAQKMDALSSMANIAGYRAVVEAAGLFGRFFTGQITAAGKVPPAKVMVIGAGVAGLAAIGTARGLGAIVRAFDVRPEVAEQVKSMGAEFLFLEFESDESGGTTGGYAKTMSKEFIDAEMALFAQQAKEVDIIITTALIPGRPAPQLLSKQMVESMKPGSVVVDLAVERGGNVAGVKPGKVATHKGVILMGHLNVAGRLAADASSLYARNLVNFISPLVEDKALKIDWDDEIITGTLIAREGALVHPMLTKGGDK